MEFAKITETGIEIVSCDVEAAEKAAAKALKGYEEVKAAYEEVKALIEAQNDVTAEEKESLEVLESEVNAVRRISENATRKAQEEKVRQERYLNDGFLPFVTSEQPEAESEKQKVVSALFIQDGKVIQLWKIEKNEVYFQRLIDKAKEDLASTDYKVLKCYEASLAGESLPYDIQQLHGERQALRDEINLLEAAVISDL